MVNVYIICIDTQNYMNLCFIFQHKFPKAQVNVYITVLQNDGCGKYNVNEHVFHFYDLYLMRTVDLQ